jgi:hypothetical protein
MQNPNQIRRKYKPGKSLEQEKRRLRAASWAAALAKVLSANPKLATAIEAARVWGNLSSAGYLRASLATFTICLFDDIAETCDGRSLFEGTSPQDMELARRLKPHIDPIADRLAAWSSSARRHYDIEKNREAA